MARATINIPFAKSGYVKESEPNTVFLTDSNTIYDIALEVLGNSTYHRGICFGIGSIPSALQHARLYGISFTFYLYADETYSASSDISTLWIYPAGNFSPSTLTYNTKPSMVSVPKGEHYPKTSIQKKVWGNYVSYNVDSDVPALSKSASIYLQNRSVYLQQYNTRFDVWRTKTVLANGSDAPYITVEYDDTETVKSIISGVNLPSGNKNPTLDLNFYWNLIRDENQDYYCIATYWEQASGTLYWRESGADTWNQIVAVNSTVGGSATIPANTLAAGKTYEYYIEATDVFGNTSQTSVGTFKTPTTQLTQTNCPTSGYVNPRNAVSFEWYYNSSIGTFAAGSTTLHWRVSGAENWTDVQAVTGANSLTIPANTFPTASTIQWYLSGTDSTGYASQTSVYSFSTAAGAITAQAVSPSNTVQSNNQPITFNWTYSSPDGFAPSRYKFMWKLVTDADWTTLVDSTEVVNTYTFPAYTFPAGEIRWGVVPYNIDGTAGTGRSVTFVCYGAPDAPVVYAENAPFTTVSWQASDQQAYQIKVDDTVYGPYFGTEKTLQIPDKLEDGEHTVGVSVVGTYGLWSDWGTSIINVQNVPGEEIVLGGNGGVDVFLSWATAEETSDFLIFRDNVQIGRTAEISFTDRYAAGEHTYKVINRFSDGNYSESNEVTLDTNIDGTYISLLSGGEWLKIKYMLKSASDQEYEESVETVYNHFAGDSYPSVSISKYRERALKYSAVFLNVDEADHTAFKNMLRKPVVMKFENGNVIAGVIDSWTVLHRKHYYTAYTFSLRQIEWEDYVDDTT